MKKIQFVLEDAEYEKAVKKKGDRTWVQFLMDVVDA